jgi:hypothetical protein
MEKFDLKVKDRVHRDFEKRINSFEVIDKLPRNILYIRISLGDFSDSKSYQFEVDSRQYFCVTDFVFGWIFKMGYWKLGRDGKYYRFWP